MIPPLTFKTPLFVAGDRPERFGKAAAAGADAVIIDLEDAVAPGAKDRACASLRTDFTDLPVVVRINGANTPWHSADLAVVANLRLTAIMVPKAELDGTLEAIARGPAGHIPIVALVETARGPSQARQIGNLPGLARLAFGSIDLCADLGCDHTREALLSARNELVIASRLAGKPAPIDGVTTVLDDERLIEDDARYERILGFGGKLCIHPRQVEPARRGYHPSSEEIAWAKRILATEGGASKVDGAMVDEPVRIRARTILMCRIFAICSSRPARHAALATQNHRLRAMAEWNAVVGKLA